MLPEATLDKFNRERRAKFLTWCYEGGNFKYGFAEELVEILPGEVFSDPNSLFVNIRFPNGNIKRVDIGHISRYQ